MIQTLIRGAIAAALIYVFLVAFLSLQGCAQPRDRITHQEIDARTIRILDILAARALNY